MKNQLKNKSKWIILIAIVAFAFVLSPIPDIPNAYANAECYGWDDDNNCNYWGSSTMICEEEDVVFEPCRGTSFWNPTE